MATVTTAGLKSYLSVLGVDITDDTTLQGFLGLALEELEHVSGYSPFVSSGSDSTITMDVPIHNYGAAYPITKRMEVSFAQKPSVSYGGVTLTEGTDYDWPEAKAKLGNKPFDMIRVLRWIGTTKLGLSITGRVGYLNSSSDYPASLVQALYQYASGLYFSALTASRTGVQGESWTDGDVSMRNSSATILVAGSKPLANSPAGMMEEARSTFSGYKRMVAYL